MTDPRGIASSDTGTQPARPPQVLLAVRLLWTSLSLGVVNSAIPVPNLPSNGQTLFVQAVTIAILAWLTYKIWVGRNWARITFAVMMAFGLLIYAPEMSMLFRFSSVVGTISLFQCLLQLVALYLLFTEPGRGWFKASTSVA